MSAQPSIATLVAAGGAKIPATTVVRNGQLVNVVSADINPADVAIFENTVVAIGDETIEIDAGGRYLVPGLFDGHQHLERSKLAILSSCIIR